MCRKKSGACHFLHNIIDKGRILMGAILDLTEKLKEPSGMIGAVVIIAAAYFFVKWVFAEHNDDSQDK
jgi:hypothetical protein